jgi:hypothetical protein
LKFLTLVLLHIFNGEEINENEEVGTYVTQEWKLTHWLKSTNFLFPSEKLGSFEEWVRIL